MMKQTNTRFVEFVGIDVSKDKLDFFASADCLTIEFGNEEPAIAQTLGPLKSRLQQALVVVEATGSYEQAIVDWCHANGVVIAVVNPKQARDFAKGIGRNVKTDPIDATVLARFGEVVLPEPKAQKSDAARKLNALVTRRKQLVDLINQESNRLGQTQDPDVVKMIKTSLKDLKKQLSHVDQRIAKTISSDESNASKIAILDSVPGVGPVTIATILAELPELGSLTRTEVAKLVGVAPINNDSGTKSGRRKTMGGRRYVRKILYMATLVATRYNRRIKEYYQRLVKRGKEKKVALVAAMRKLITILNQLIKSDQLYCENNATSA